jgi:peptide/nickel transport system permease protein
VLVEDMPDGLIGRCVSVVWSVSARGAHWLVRHKLLAFALAIWAVTVLAACFPWLLAGGDPNAQDLPARLTAPEVGHHLLGTDELGEDVYTRLVYGARTSMLVGFGAVAIGGVAGTVLGLAGGYCRRGGRIVAALVDVQMAFPGLLLFITIVVMVGRASVLILAIILGATGWAGYARVVRGLVLSLRKREFVLAARASGCGSLRIIATHLVPNIAGTLTVLAVLDLCRAILAEATISFIGLGIQPPTVSWGLMLAAGRDYMNTALWLVTFPGIAIALVVLSATVIANELQNRVDPLRRTLRSI